MKQIRTLTEAEYIGLQTQFNLADGHAYQDLDGTFAGVVEALPALWREAQQTPIPEMERAFRTSYARLFGSKALGEHPHFSLCPSSSNSIDIVSAWLHMRGYRTGL